MRVKLQCVQFNKFQFDEENSHRQKPAVVQRRTLHQVAHKHEGRMYKPQCFKRVKHTSKPTFTFRARSRYPARCKREREILLGACQCDCAHNTRPKSAWSRTRGATDFAPGVQPMRVSKAGAAVACAGSTQVHELRHVPGQLQKVLNWARCRCAC